MGAFYSIRTDLARRYSVQSKQFTLTKFQFTSDLPYVCTLTFLAYISSAETPWNGEHLLSMRECRILHAPNHYAIVVPAMAVDVSIEGTENIPESPHLVLVNRLHLPTLRVLESALGGEEKVAWLIEDSLRPSREITNYVSHRRGGGILFSLTRQKRETLRAQIKAKLTSGCHVVLLLGRPEQPPACVSDVPPALLSYLLEDVQGEIIPVYEGLYSLHSGSWEPSDTESAFTRALLRIMPSIRPGVATARSIATAWAIASAEQTASVAKQNTSDSLSGMLLRSLLAHPRSVIIDGVNEQRMSYRHLLSLAVPLARRLRRHINTRRLGIILPPGRLSIIANTACILAGITPVNIDFTYPPSVFRRMVEQAHVSRFLSGHNFAENLEDFAWPPKRDILYVDELLSANGGFLRTMQDFFIALLGKTNIENWIHTPELSSGQEAVVLYNSYSDGTGLHGVSMSHCAILTGYRLTQCRIGNGEKERILSCLPFHHRAGFLLGLLYPLLEGEDIITYPDPKASKRLCELILRYKPTRATVAPEQVPPLLAACKEEEFSSLRLLVAGQVSANDARQAYAVNKIHLCECYLPRQVAMPVACSLPPQTEMPEMPKSLRIHRGSPGAAGQPLSGLAVRIGSLDSDIPLQKDEIPGLIYVKGPACCTCSASEAIPPDTQASRWICTGDIGFLREDGQLVVMGPHEDFSMVGGELISHRETERLLASLLNIPSKIGEAPKFVVVALESQDNRHEDTLVLLSTLHKTVGPHDVITLRYTFINARYSKNMAPHHIIPLRAIPTLPGGAVNYPLCRILAARSLGVKPPLQR